MMLVHNSLAPDFAFQAKNEEASAAAELERSLSAIETIAEKPDASLEKCTQAAEAIDQLVTFAEAHELNNDALFTKVVNLAEKLDARIAQLAQKNSAKQAESAEARRTTASKAAAPRPSIEKKPSSKIRNRDAVVREQIKTSLSSLISSMKRNAQRQNDGRVLSERESFRRMLAESSADVSKSLSCTMDSYQQFANHFAAALTDAKAIQARFEQFSQDDISPAVAEEIRDLEDVFTKYQAILEQAQSCTEMFIEIVNERSGFYTPRHKMPARNEAYAKLQSQIAEFDDLSQSLASKPEQRIYRAVGNALEKYDFAMLQQSMDQTQEIIDIDNLEAEMNYRELRSMIRKKLIGFAEHSQDFVGAIEAINDKSTNYQELEATLEKLDLGINQLKEYIEEVQFRESQGIELDRDRVAFDAMQELLSAEQEIRQKFASTIGIGEMRGSQYQRFVMDQLLCLAMMTSIPV